MCVKGQQHAAGLTYLQSFQEQAPLQFCFFVATAALGV